MTGSHLQLQSQTPALFAWDLGANRGHVTQLLDLQPALHGAGFSIHAAVNRVRVDGPRLMARGIPVLQSPLSDPHPAPRFPPHSLAHIFHNRGYADVDELEAMVAAWRNLMQLTGARLILADGAVPALIAARTLGLPVANLSTPFHVPPQQIPFPLFSGNKPEASETENLEASLDAALHAVMARLGCEAPERLVDLFNVDAPGFFCFPELDCYGERPGTPYRGPLFGEAQGRPFEWPSGKAGAPHVFVYLPANLPCVPQVLRALVRLGWPTVACCPGFLQVPALASLEQHCPTLRMHDNLLDMRQVRREADLAVGNGSLAFTHAVLLAGKPLLLMPNDSEKTLIAQRVVAMGAGLILSKRDVDEYVGALRTLADNTKYAAAACSFARNYAEHEMSNLAQQFAEQCRALVDSPKKTS